MRESKSRDSFRVTFKFAFHLHTKILSYMSVYVRRKAERGHDLMENVYFFLPFPQVCPRFIKYFLQIVCNILPHPHERCRFGLWNHPFQLQ